MLQHLCMVTDSTDVRESLVTPSQAEGAVSLVLWQGHLVSDDLLIELRFVTHPVGGECLLYLQALVEGVIH